MASRSRKAPTSGAQRIKRWFSHRSLVAVEALLVAGLLEALAEGWVVAQGDIPNPLKVLFSMILVVGVFGGLMVAFESVAQRSIDKTTGMVRALPLPTPLLAVHAAFFVVIFFGYAWQMELGVW